MLGEVAGLRSDDGWFAPRDIDQIFESLRLPRPANVSQALVQLRRHGLVVQRRKKGQAWSVSPLGRRRIQDLLGSLDYPKIAAEMANSPGAEFAHVRHSVISPSFAPARWVPGIMRLLDRFPFEANVFGMTRYPKSETDTGYLDPVKDVIEVVRSALKDHGLTLHLASDRQLDDELFGNVGAYMWACQYGIGLLEDRADSGLNYNVVAELGGMLITGRRCALLKDRTAPTLPTDLVGHIYKPVDFDDLAAVAGTVHLWVSEDLGLGRCRNCPTAEPQCVAKPEATRA